MNKKKSVVKRKQAVKKPAEVKLEGSTPLPLFDKNLVPNPLVKTLYADIVQTVNRSDGFTQLSFYSRVPGKNLETTRVVLPFRVMASLVETFCKSTNFVPKI